MIHIKEVWKVWKYTLGSFQDQTTKKYDDIICIIRTFIFVQLVLTNCFIIAGNIRHWNDNHGTITTGRVQFEGSTRVSP